MKIERLWHPYMVKQYYDRTVFLSPLFLILTVVYAAATWHAVRILRHNLTGVLIITLIASLWVHLIIHHSWFRSEDSDVLRKNAAKTTLIFSIAYVVTVGILLSFIR